MKAKVIDRDKGFKRIVKRLRQAAGGRGPRVMVGFTQESAGAEHPGDDGEGELSIVDIAAIHEFGAPERKIPARSMLRATADESIPKYKKLFRKAAVDDILGKRTLAQGLERMGLQAVSDVRTRINAGIEPALSETTIAAKGSALPLVDTGLLKGALTHEVRK